MQRETGDVLPAQENEAFLALEELGKDQIDIDEPAVSVLPESTMAVMRRSLATMRSAPLRRFRIVKLPNIRWALL